MVEAAAQEALKDLFATAELLVDFRRPDLIGRPESERKRALVAAMIEADHMAAMRYARDWMKGWTKG